MWVGTFLRSRMYSMPTESNLGSNYLKWVATMATVCNFMSFEFHIRMLVHNSTKPHFDRSSRSNFYKWVWLYKMKCFIE